MRVAVFSAQDYDKQFMTVANEESQHELVFIEFALGRKTVERAKGFEIVSCFVLDNLSAQILEQLAAGGTKLIALRSVGYDHVDLEAAKRLGIQVVNVPAYSPSAVAELAVMLALILARKFTLTEQRFANNDYRLEGLLGIGLQAHTVGIVGTGNIGVALAKILQGFGAKILGYDPYPNPECEQLGVEYVSLEACLSQSDVISLHCPLTPQTRHLLNVQMLALCKPTALLINTSRGPVVDTQAVLDALNNHQLAGYGMDVYEYEKGLFFVDRSSSPITDELFLALKAHPNVVMTGHQGFFTEAALSNIARTTINNITRYTQGEVKNEVTG